MEEEKKIIKKLIIDLPPEKHAQIKMRSAQRNISMKTYVLRAIQKAILEEDKYK